MNNNNFLLLRTTSIISFAAAIALFLVPCYQLLLTEARRDKYSEFRKEDWILFVVFAICCFSTIIYIVKTNFGNVYTDELKKIEIENEVIKRKIEQKELLDKLNNRKA